MKKLLLLVAVAGLSFSFTYNQLWNDRAEAIAISLCDCGSKEGVVEKFEKAEKEPSMESGRAAQESFKAMIGCMGGEKEMNKLWDGMTAEERKSFELLVSQKIQARCPKLFEIVFADNPQTPK